MPHVKVGSAKALNRWDLSSQHVTPTTISFLKAVIKAFTLAIHRLLLMSQSNHVNRNQYQGTYIHGLSQLSPA